MIGRKQDRLVTRRAPRRLGIETEDKLYYTIDVVHTTL